MSTISASVIHMLYGPMPTVGTIYKASVSEHQVLSDFTSCKDNATKYY